VLEQQQRVTDLIGLPRIAQTQLQLERLAVGNRPELDYA
jgi:hypothetical protein